MHRAVACGYREVVELLIAQGAEVNAQDKGGVTALHIAAGKGDQAMVELLIAQGANVNALDNVGLTPLHWMAGVGNQTLPDLSISQRVNKPECLMQNELKLSTAFFYDHPIPMKLFSQFNRVVIESENFTDFHKTLAYKAEVFAYISVGEAEDWRSVKPALKSSWILGTNQSWGNKIIDLTQRGWREYLLKERMTPLWMAGYRAFFLDTIDSYQAVVKDKSGRANQEKALVDLIQTIKNQFPNVKLLINRGFEIMPQIGRLVEGVIAESLFYSWNPIDRRYIAINDNDRFWLVKQLREIRSRYHLPVVVVDYLPPHLQEKAHQTAKRIAELGFIPWITNHSLNKIYINAAEQAQTYCHNSS
jgi:hypothetical protein